MTWTVESFTPSDGTMVSYVAVDHQAWLRADDPTRERKPVHVAIAISSRDVPTELAQRYLDAMVAGLNAAKEPAQ